MSLKTKLFDPANYLDSDSMVVAYLSEALDTGDPALVADVLGDIARARGMSALARAAGLSRESLYRTLSARGNPELGTVLKILKALNLRLSAVSTRRKRPPSAAGATNRRRETIKRAHGVAPIKPPPAARR